MVCYRLADIRPMFVAIKDGNIEGVKQAIAEGADMNAQTIGGWTPLHIAVSVRFASMAQSSGV